jgi:subtilisin family serine protease
MSKRKVIITFKYNAVQKQITELSRRYHLTILDKYASLKNTFLAQFISSREDRCSEILNRLNAEEIVKIAHANLVNQIAPCFIPTDGLFKRQWSLKSEKTAASRFRADVNAMEAWDITRGDRKIVVAIIDTGFDLTHPDFNVPGKIVYAKDYVNSCSPFISKDKDEHGTYCAGIALAESNGHGIVGIAHGCSFMPVRVPLEPDDHLLIKIFEETAAKAHVISCSWGPVPVNAPLSWTFYKCLKKLAHNGGPWGKGCVICFSANNFNAPINDPDNDHFLWTDYRTQTFRTTKGPIINGYAAHPAVITVAACTSLNKKAAYSNWGKEVNVCAPSNNFHPYCSDFYVEGERKIWTTGDANGSRKTRYTKNFGGTSSATPLVAGTAALVLSVNPHLTAAQVKGSLQDTADKVIDTNRDIILGNDKGSYVSGHSEWFGYGKINAGAAVRKAKKMLRKKQINPNEHN